MNQLPPRTANTMSLAISLSSPNGKTSKRAKEAAVKRLSVALFGENGLQLIPTEQPSEKERLLRVAKELRELAARGMKPRAHIKEAQRLETLAESL